MIKNNAIGVCVTSIHQPSVHKVLTELGKEAKKRGYYLQIFAPFSDLYHKTKNDSAQKKIFNLIDYNKICCLIIFTEMIKDESVQKELANHAIAANVPVISIKQSIPGCCNIRYDSEAALDKIIRHLIEVHNCTKINFIAGLCGNEISERRLNIYKNVLNEYNFPVEEQRIGYGDFWSLPAKKATEEFLNSDIEKPDAIVCANDAMAIAVVDCLLNHKIRVPEDIIVTGLGGIQEREYHIPLLTSAIYDPVMSSDYILNTMEEILTGKYSCDNDIIIPCQPVYTESCGCVLNTKYENDKRLEKLFVNTEKEHNYSHAIHEFNSFINVDCTIETLARLLPNYLWGPEISALNLYIEAEFASMIGFKLTSSEDTITEPHLLLLNQISETNCLTPLCPVQYINVPDKDNAVNCNFNNILIIPLNVMDENLGVITIDYDGSNIYHDCLYELTMTLDNILGTIKNRAELLQTNQQLNALSEQTIQSLAEIVEAKSEFTGLHVKRVSEYTRILAEAMGYPPEEVDTIRIASMMHDIGKINIPSSILEKPGKLTDEEFNVIKTHVTEGEKLLRHSPGKIMQTARIIALQHHEKWNGKGYLGLKGTDIALESRIVALADVFDALVSKRPYKSAFSDHEAYDIITKDSGSHFDPEVVRAFVQNYYQFLNIHAKYKDN